MTTPTKPRSNYARGRDLEHRVRTELGERFMSKFSINEEAGCWVWDAYTDPRGYGRYTVSKADRSALAYRVAWVAVHGAVPEGMELDHLCRNPSCVNPAHLEPVTHQENCQRGAIGETTRTRMLARTHCARGHEWTPENTRQTPRQRKCRTCIREDRMRARERRNRDQ
jgi:hypothetical protein